ncbi:restriction endonuclease subunit S [Mesonia maritima]|uniref:restriction endonuclease subunit S n=1 Tax=Mesonia maritima TaxID=1793873 RepID=UPI0036266B6D
MERYNDYKDSGIEWLGNIPKHWETFRFIDNVKLRHGYQFRDYDFTDEGIRVVKISQLDPKGNLNLTKSSFIASDRLNSFKAIRIYQDDILMALTGGTIGKIIRVGKISEPLLQNYRVGNFFPDKKKLNKTFLYFLLASQVTEEQINYLLNRNGQPNIGKESFKNMFFTLPPLKEQAQIANYLDAKTTSIDKKK